MPTESPPMTLGTPAADFSLPSTTGATVRAQRFRRAACARRGVHLQPLPVRPPHRVTARPRPRRLPGPRCRCRRHLGQRCRRLPRRRRAPTSPSKPRGAGFEFPYLYDETQDVARSYGAACTPDLFVFDADRRLAYAGSSTARGRAAALRQPGNRCGGRSTTCSQDGPCRRRTGRASAVRSSGDSRPGHSELEDDEVGRSVP